MSHGGTGGGGIQKSAKRVSSIIWMAPFAKKSVFFYWRIACFENMGFDFWVKTWKAVSHEWEFSQCPAHTFCFFFPIHDAIKPECDDHPRDTNIVAAKLLTGGRCSEVPLFSNSEKWDFKIVVVVDRRLLAQVWLYLKISDPLWAMAKSTFICQRNLEQNSFVRVWTLKALPKNCRIQFFTSYLSTSWFLQFIILLDLLCVSVCVREWQMLTNGQFHQHVMTAFVSIFLCQKNTNLKSKHKKA